MNYLTIKEFARKHKVSRQAIEYQIFQGNLSPVVKFGVRVLPANIKYKPRKKSKVC